MEDFASRKSCGFLLFSWKQTQCMECHGWHSCQAAVLNSKQNKYWNPAGFEIWLWKYMYWIRISVHFEMINYLYGSNRVSSKTQGSCWYNSLPFIRTRPAAMSSTRFRAAAAALASASTSCTEQAAGFMRHMNKSRKYLHASTKNLLHPEALIRCL
jgi:hypothetical protein